MNTTHKINADALRTILRKSELNKPGKKILFACVPADGHFNPLLPLAIHLLSEGYDVRWYTSEKYAKKTEAAGITHYPFKNALDISSKPPAELFPEREQIKSKIKKLVFDMTNGFVLRAPEYYEDIKEIHKIFPFDIVIADCLFFAIPFIKHNLDVPVISIGVVPLLESSRDIAPPGLGLTPPASLFQRIKYKALHYITTAMFKKPTGLLRQLLKQYGIAMNINNMFDYMIRESSLLLQIGTPGFEYKRSDIGSNIRFIGASLPAAGTQKKWYSPKLRQYRKVILVTQGTVEKDISKLIVPALTAFKNSEYLVIATTGGSHTEELRKQFNYENIIIEDFIPFDEVMPIANVYISNGGYGGVTFSIKHKLPMVVAGIHEGKSEINARVGYFGIGINLQTERPAPQAIKTAVLKIFQDGAYRANIQILSDEFNTYNANRLCGSYIDKAIEKHYRNSFIKSK